MHIKYKYEVLKHMQAFKWTWYFLSSINGTKFNWSNHSIIVFIHNYPTVLTQEFV